MSCKTSICTIIGYICYGKFFDVNSEDVAIFLDGPNKFPRLMAFGVICDFLPWMKFLVRKQLQELEDLLAALRNIGFGSIGWLFAILNSFMSICSALWATCWSFSFRTFAN